MRCEETMKHEVAWLAPSDTVQVAAQKMRDANVGFLPVVDGSSHVLGVVTDRDIAIRLVAADGRASETAVEAVMTREIVACRPQDDLSTWAQLMADNQVSRVCCVDDTGCLTGVVSLSDLATIERERAAQTLEKVASREAEAPPSVH